MLAKESSSSLFKIGDGTKTWSQLPYVNVPATVAPKALGTAAVGTSAKYAREDHVHPIQTTITGNAATATKLATARTISLTGPVTGSAKFDGSGNVSLATTVDFSGMPTDKFEAMLKSIRVPIWLTANKTFYVATNGSDVLSAGRGESASAPFKTLQACYNYIADNYNLSRFTVSIRISDGNYYDKSYYQIELGSYNSISGCIVIIGNQSNHNKVILPPISVRKAKVAFYSITISSLPTVAVQDWSLMISSYSEVYLYDVCLDNSNLQDSTGNWYNFIGVSEFSLLLIDSASTTSTPVGLYLKNGTGIRSPSHFFHVDNSSIVRIYADINIESNFNSRFLYLSGRSTFHIANKSWHPNPGRAPRVNLLNNSSITSSSWAVKYVVSNFSLINTSGSGIGWFPNPTAGTCDNTSKVV